MTPKEDESSPAPTDKNSNSFVFAIVVLVYEILIFFLYGFLYGYSDLLTSRVDDAGILLTSILALLLLAGTIALYI